MRSRTGKICVALLTAMLMLWFVGCPQEADDAPSKSKAAELTALTVAQAEGAEYPFVDNTVGEMPVPFTMDDLDVIIQDSNGNLLAWAAEGYLGTIDVLAKTSSVDAAINLTVSAKATAYIYKLANTTWTPTTLDDAEFVYASGEVIQGLTGENNYFMVQVIAEDKKNEQFYLFKASFTAENSSAALSAITIGGVTVNRGNSNVAWASVTAGSVALSGTANVNPAVTITKAVDTQVVKYAVITKANFDDETPPAAWSDFTGTNITLTGTTLNDGDYVAFEVTAENGINKAYYIIEVQKGRNANLTSLTINGETKAVGTPGATWQTAVAAERVALTDVQPQNGSVLVGTTADPDATVRYGRAANAQTAPTWNAAGSNVIEFNDGDIAYVEVTSGSGSIVQFYAIGIQLQQMAYIKYGSPTLQSGTLDVLWNDPELDDYELLRVFPGNLNAQGQPTFTDSTQAYYNNPNTFGSAKMMWDDTGIYVFMRVSDPQITTGSGDTNTHTYDSVEILIAETDDLSLAFATYGSQYRVAARSNLRSGNPTAATDAWNVNSNTTYPSYTWVIDGSDPLALDGKPGYVILTKVPFRVASFDRENDSVMGFDLQINACTGAGGNGTLGNADGRQGVMVWNNTTQSNYNTIAGFGKATLVGRPDVVATQPVITGPVAHNYALGSNVVPLSVTATKAEADTQTFQWYSADSATGAATLIGSQTNASYTPSIGTAGDKWYEVVVTNTNNAADEGYKVKTATSARVQISVADTAGTADRYNTINRGGAPYYEFVLPAGKTWGNYTKVTAEFYLNAQNRGYATGNVAADMYISATMPTANVAYNNPAVNTRVISAKTGAQFGTEYATADTWGTVTWSLANSAAGGNFSAALRPANTATGPFYLAFGPTRGTGQTSTIAYYVRNVKLSNDDGTDTVAANRVDFNAVNTPRVQQPVTNAVTANYSRVTLPAKPEITASQLVNAPYSVGDTNITPLSVTATGDSLSYQWWSTTTENAAGTAIAGATAYTYTPLAGEEQVGDTWYWVVVTNTANGMSDSVTSTRAKITVEALPETATLVSIAVTGGPTKIDYTVGDRLNLAGLVVEGTFDDETKSVVSSDSYDTVPADDTELATAGVITVTVSVDTITTTFNITVKPAAPVIDTGTDSGTNLADAEYFVDGTNITALKVVATGDNLSYQWWSATTEDGAGAAIPDATANTHTPVVTAVGTTWYWVVVTANAGALSSTEATSTKAKITVTAASVVAAVPDIDDQSADKTVEVAAGGTTQLSVSASTTDGGTLSYQWWKGTSAIDEGAAIPSAIAATYEADISTVGETWYWVVVTNTLGTDSKTAKSAVVKVTVTPEDVSGTFTLTPNGTDTLNPVGLNITAAKKVGSTVTITLGSSSEVESGLSDYMEESVYDLSAQGDAVNMALGFTYISLDGILKAGSAYTIKQTNQSLNLYAVNGAGFNNHGQASVYKQSTTPELTSNDNYTFLLWNGADPKTATIEVTPVGTEETTTYVVDWSGVDIETPVNVSDVFTLTGNSGTDTLNPENLQITAATKLGSTVTIQLGGAVANGVSPYMEDNWFGLSSNSNPTNANMGYSYISLNGILKQGNTYSIKQTNQSLNLYATADGSFSNHGQAGVYKTTEVSTALPADDFYTFLLWAGAEPKTATIEVTENGETTTTYVVDWSGVTINE